MFVPAPEVESALSPHRLRVCSVGAGDSHGEEEDAEQAAPMWTVLVRSPREPQDPFSSLYLSSFFFPFLSFPSFSFLFALAETSDPMLNKGGTSGCHRPGPDLRGKAFGY